LIWPASRRLPPTYLRHSSVSSPMIVKKTIPHSTRH
jgi:hypothetical protein